MYQEQQQRERSMLSPDFNKNLVQCITVLQELQTLLGMQATLDDVLHIVQNIENEFGRQTQRETAIQSLVGRHLEQQLAMRKRRKVVV